jgi:hypothetical protein
LAALVPPDVVTRTLAVPAIPGGVVAVTEVSLYVSWQELEQRLSFQPGRYLCVPQ